jgi:hypothetical protein
MGRKLNQLLDFLSDFLAHRKGLLPMLGILLIVCNGILQFLPVAGWLVDTNLLLHIGIVVALVGILLAWAL